MKLPADTNVVCDEHLCLHFILNNACFPARLIPSSDKTCGVSSATNSGVTCKIKKECFLGGGEEDHERIVNTQQLMNSVQRR